MNEYLKDWCIELGKFSAGLVGESVINHSGIGDIKLLYELGNKVWKKACNDAIDYSQEVLDEREKKLSTIISKVTFQKLPDDFEEFYQVISVAAEISLKHLYIFYYKYDCGKVATILAKEYIKEKQHDYEEKELGLLNNYLSDILQETIKNVQDELNHNTEFTVQWRRYVESILQDHKTEIDDLKKHNVLIGEKIDGLTSRVEHVESDVTTMKQDIVDFQSNNKKTKVRECRSDYEMNWNDVLFLEDPDSEKAVHLKDVYVLPTYQDKRKKNHADLKDILQGVIDADDDYRERMLVILGQPGSGKTTLITYLLNNCNFQKKSTVRMYCFRKFKQVDWKNTDEIFSQMLESMHLQEKDLNDSVLILDGLDEVNMGNRQTEFLNDIFRKYIRTADIKNFSLFITCRNNRIENISELTPRHININFLDEGKIEEFVGKYNKIKDENNYINLLQELKDVVGIPIILYIILAKQIKITEETNLVKIYDMIFLPSSPYNIYSRSKYDEMHVIASEEKKQIYDFSKKVSVEMWKKNPNEASLGKDCYEKISEKIIGEGKSHDLLIGQYFIEGKDSCELYFIHRSMYEYFVALSIFDAIQDMMGKESPSDKIKELQNNFCTLKDSKQKNLEITSFAEIIGINLIYSDPDIEQYLSYMLENRPIKDNQFWKKFFACFLDNGLTRYVDDYKESTIECFGKELTRFYNLIWLTREQLRSADGVQVYYKVAEIDEKLYFYLRQRKRKRVDLSKIDLEKADLSEADLSEANLSEANLSEVNLNGANLNGANLNGVDLFFADLSEANLSEADLSVAYTSDAEGGLELIEAELIGANLSRANLSEADLTEADLTEADLSKADLNGAVLRRTNLNGANLNGADLNGANLNGAALRGADLRRAALRGADLTDANLNGAALNEADLRGADLRGANLTEADLRGANLNDITMYKEELRKAILDEENYIMCV